MKVTNLLVVSAACMMFSGCFCAVGDCGGDTAQAADGDLMRVEQAANRADDAAMRAEGAADKAEAIFHKGLQK